MERRVCGCKGCDEPVIALGMCNKHWRRNRLYGSPFALRSHSGMMKGLSAEQRFNKQHKKTSECWVWSASVDRDGYGRFDGVVHGVRHAKAHRFSWSFHNSRPIPKGMVVCHSCDNPACVNPAHLWLGTVAENQQDMAQKGRSRKDMRGATNSRAKLTEEQARAILSDARPYAQIAADYSVTTMTISDIKCRRSWAHIDVEFIGKAPRVSPQKGKCKKVTPDIVRAIRSSTEQGSVLAIRYGVSRSLICNIIKRRSWAHVS